MSRNAVVLFGAAALAAAAVAWFATRGDGRLPPPDRVPGGPGPLVSGTHEESVTSLSIEPATPRPADERVRSYLDELRARDWKGTDALGESRAFDFVRDPGAVSALVGVAGGAGDPEDRAAALLVLGWSRSSEARTILTEALDGVLGADLRTAAIWSLANADPAWAVPLLRHTAVGSGDLSIATTAIQALLMQEGPGALDAIGEALDRAGDDAPRRRALYGILFGRSPEVDGWEPELVRDHRTGRTRLFHAPEELPLEFQDAARRILRLAAQEVDGEMARAAALAILEIPGEDARSALGELWENGGDDLMQSVLMRVNPGRRDGHFRGILARLPATKSRDARDTASLLLGDVHDPAFLPDLRRWAEAEGDAEIRARIEKAVARIESR